MSGVKGKSGRKRKPKAVLKLHGTFRADRHGGAEAVEAPTAIPTPPKLLRGIALAEWDRITTLLADNNCIAELDMATLTMYCVEWAKYVKANQRLAKVRTFLTSSTKGSKMPHPLLRVSNKAFANLMRLCSEFGFSPAARARLSIEAKAAGSDPLEQLLRNQMQRRANRPGGNSAG